MRENTSVGVKGTQEEGQIEFSLHLGVVSENDATLMAAEDPTILIPLSETMHKVKSCEIP